MTRVSGARDEDANLARFGRGVRARRKVLALSQEALADLAGIDRSHMGKIERGERNLTFLNIIRIADALGCKPSELLIDSGI